MTLDHIGSIFFPNQEVFRIIGRSSFPIFAFLLIQGYTHTRSRKKYLLRLFLFGCLSEIFYDFAFYHTFFYSGDQNVLLTLFLGLLLLCFLSKIDKFLQFLDNATKILTLFTIHFFLVFLFCLLALVFSCDYTIYGILLIYFFYLFRNHIWFYSLILIGLSSLTFIDVVAFNQIWSLLSFPILYLYNGQKGKSFKYFFYLYYPLHLLILGLL